MKRMVIAAVMLGGCSTTATPKDIEITSAGVLFGIEACERHALDGVPLDQAASEAARGRKHERYGSTVPGANIAAPNWKLDGLVWVGLTPAGACDVYAASGSGPALRDLVVSTHLGMSSRRWSRMSIVKAPEGGVRDAVCTVDRVGDGKSMGVVMTSRTDSNVTMQRTFVATVLKASAADFIERADT